VTNVLPIAQPQVPHLFTLADVEGYLKGAQREILTTIEATHSDGFPRDALKRKLKGDINRLLEQARHDASKR
jgi:hypothetical protein